MARTIADGEVRIEWVPVITNQAAPTAAEIAAGTNVTGAMSSLETPEDGTTPDASDLSDPFDKTVAGTFGGAVSSDMYREDDSEVIFNLFARNTTGYIVLRRFGGSEVPIATADVVEVRYLRVVTRSPSPLERNTVQTFTVQYASLDSPKYGSVIAA